MSRSWLACLWETLIHADIIAGFAINQFVLLLFASLYPRPRSLHGKVMGWPSEDNGTWMDAPRGGSSHRLLPPHSTTKKRWNRASGRSREEAAGPWIRLERFWFSWLSDAWYIKLLNSVVSMAAWVHLVPVTYDYADRLWLWCCGEQCRPSLAKTITCRTISFFCMESTFHWQRKPWRRDM